MSLLAVVLSRIQRPTLSIMPSPKAWRGSPSLFVFLGKLAGAAREMAMGYRYGVGEEVDAYLFIVSLVSCPQAVWFSVLASVSVPLAARIRQDATAELPRFRAELFALALLLGLTLSLERIGPSYRSWV